MSNENEDRKNLNTNTLALMQLTEKLTENNNTVSGTMRIMSENISEISSIVLRSEDKIDDCKKTLEEHCKLWNPNNQIIIDFIGKLNEAGFAEFLLRIKKLWKGVLITIVSAIIIAAAKWIYGAWQIIQKLLDHGG